MRREMDKNENEKKQNVINIVSLFCEILYYNILHFVGMVFP